MFFVIALMNEGGVAATVRISGEQIKRVNKDHIGKDFKLSD